MVVATYQKPPQKTFDGEWEKSYSIATNRLNIAIACMNPKVMAEMPAILNNLAYLIEATGTDGVTSKKMTWLKAVCQFFTLIGTIETAIMTEPCFNTAPETLTYKAQDRVIRSFDYVMSERVRLPETFVVQVAAETFFAKLKPANETIEKTVACFQEIARNLP
ncbi:MAG: hypothetical protein WC045_00290 [Patescibacteria group bacterium]